ncbi:hypothetical protein C8039_10540 [Halogeometricum sp. wsp3]|nr:hypothetical protein C8039_10540 [Halogeometricum sp. wsp3]
MPISLPVLVTTVLPTSSSVSRIVAFSRRYRGSRITDVQTRNRWPDDETITSPTRIVTKVIPACHSQGGYL